MRIAYNFLIISNKKQDKKRLYTNSKTLYNRVPGTKYKLKQVTFFTLI